MIAQSKWNTAKRKKEIKTWSFEELIEDIGHQVHVWRVNAQDELVRRGGSVSSELIKTIESNTLTETQATWSLWALGHIENGRNANHAEILRIALESGDLNLRIQATRVLGENKVIKAVPVLIKLLTDDESRIRTAAMQ